VNPKSRLAALRRLRRWVARQGGRLDARLAFHVDAEGEAGLRARAPIAVGEILLDLPERLLIAQRAASGTESLAALLVREKHGWPAYVDALPIDSPNLPLFFSDDELALLEGSFTLKTIREERAEIGGLGLPRWAVAAAKSRPFGIEISGDRVDAFIPIADVFNHDSMPETAWAFDQERSRFVMCATRPIPAGAPVRDSYGVKCNSRYFLNYGFCLETNRENQAVLQFSLHGPHEFRVPADLDSVPARDMLSYLRIALLNDGEKVTCDGPDEQVAPISAENERRVFEALETACTAALARFPDPLETDEALLAGGALSRNARNAILMRRSEKLVLRSLQRTAQARLDTEERCHCTYARTAAHR
jgi:histone-lysine N-methyltransferase SETD3